MELAAKSRCRSTLGLAVAALVVAAGAIACPVPHRATGSAHAPFMAENHAAMDKTMESMAITPFGDVDRDFTAMMVPHHQGAIEMAQAELRYGRNEQLRRLAQGIIVTQQQEIEVMHLALGDALSPGNPAPTQISPSPHVHGDH